MNAQKELKQGAKFPYDASDEWLNGTDRKPLAPVDWAHAAARGVISNLKDRSGIKRGFEEIDEDIRKEIVESMADIIRTAHTETRERS